MNKLKKHLKENFPLLFSYINQKSQILHINIKVTFANVIEYYKYLTNNLFIDVITKQGVVLTFKL